METQPQRAASLIGGVLLIAFGLLAIVSEAFGGFNFWGNLWPFFIIGFGALFFIGMVSGGKSAAGLAIPGSIITGIGLMLFVQNLTGHWESWAYSWAFIPIFVGAGIYIMGMWSGDAGQRANGLGVMRIGAILFLIFGVFFEGLIFRSFGLSKFILPTVLILAGLYLVVRRSGFFPVKKADDQSDHTSTTL
jgi:hypothetical protein